MKNITLISVLITMSLLSGCNSASDSSLESEEVAETTVTSTQVSEVEVIVNEAKSPTILPENQVKTNVGYTHFVATGARY